MSDGRSFRSVSLFDEPWRWRDEEGEVATFSRWRGTPEIVSMFYVSCNFRCPLTVAKLKRVEKAFSDRAIVVHFLLVTLDPENDTPDRLRAYKQSHGLSDASWHLLAGGEKETRGLSRLLGVRPSYGDPHIDHEVKIGVVDADGVLFRTFDGWHFDEDSVVAQVAAQRARLH